MGQAANQHFGYFLFGQLCLFLGDAQQAITRVQLHQQPVAIGGYDRRDRVIRHHALSVAEGQLGFALGEGVSVLDCVVQ